MKSALILLPAFAAALTACEPEAVEEAAELLSEGGEIRLRDTLRPSTQGPRVLVIGLDGVGVEALERALREDRLPSLTALGAEARSVEEIVTILPSITLAAWSSLFTGAPPAENGIPGNEWFDRRTDRFHAPAPVSVDGRADAIASLTDGLLGEWIRVPTLFERADVRSYVSMLHVHRGADLFTAAGGEDLADLLVSCSVGVVEGEPVERELYASVDRASAEGAAALLREHGPPRLQVVYFPGVDLYTHGSPAPLVDQQAYLREVIDPAVETVMDAWSEAGALEQTWVLVVSDHGHTPVPGDEEHALATAGAGSPARVLEQRGWRVRGPELDVGDDTDHQAVVALQGAFAYVYLADRRTCPRPGDRCDWTRPPRPADVDSVAATFYHAGVGPPPGGVPAGGSGDPSGGPDVGVDRPLEMVLVARRDSTGALGAVERWTERGAVPLEDSPADTTLLALPTRLGWLLDGPAGYLAGDVVLMARSGAWVPEDRRFYFSHPYHSWHGSAHPSDSRAPLLLLRPGSTGRGAAVRLTGLPENPSQMDVVRLVLDLLEVGASDRAARGAGGGG